MAWRRRGPPAPRPEDASRAGAIVRRPVAAERRGSIAGPAPRWGDGAAEPIVVPVFRAARQSDTASSKSWGPSTPQPSSRWRPCLRTASTEGTRFRRSPLPQFGILVRDEHVSVVAPLIHNRVSPGRSASGPSRSQAFEASHRLTTFYPLYGAENDQVDRVLRVQPVEFQRVMPRYELSTSETRDRGLGPMFAGIPESPALSLLPARESEPAAVARQQGDPQATARIVQSVDAGRLLREPWLGRRVDVYA